MTHFRKRTSLVQYDLMSSLTNGKREKWRINPDLLQSLKYLLSKNVKRLRKNWKPSKTPAAIYFRRSKKISKSGARRSGKTSSLNTTKSVRGSWKNQGIPKQVFQK